MKPPVPVLIVVGVLAGCLADPSTVCDDNGTGTVASQIENEARVGSELLLTLILKNTGECTIRIQHGLTFQVSLSQEGEPSPLGKSITLDTPNILEIRAGAQERFERLRGPTPEKAGEQDLVMAVEPLGWKGTQKVNIAA